MLKGVGTGHLPVAGRSSVSFISYNHCSVPHRTSYWASYSGLLYIVGCLELCCRVSVLGIYGSLCCKRQIEIYEGCTGDHVSLVTVLNVLGQVQQLAAA